MCDLFYSSGKTESKVILEDQAVIMDVACHTQSVVLVCVCDVICLLRLSI